MLWKFLNRNFGSLEFIIIQFTMAHWIYIFLQRDGSTSFRWFIFLLFVETFVRHRNIIITLWWYVMIQCYILFCTDCIRPFFDQKIVDLFLPSNCNHLTHKQKKINSIIQVSYSCYFQHIWKPPNVSAATRGISTSLFYRYFRIYLRKKLGNV
jgi:hypothetical protein